jgi:hypothetical protein
VAPWLITPAGWPFMTAHLAGTTARLVVDPVMTGAAATGALALAGGTVLLLLRSRGRRDRLQGRST